MGVVLVGTHVVKHNFIWDRIGVGRRAFYVVYSPCSTDVPVTPKISYKLYWSIGMPKRTYSLEVLTTVPPHIDKLKRTHNSIAKQIQSIPNHSLKVCIAPQVVDHSYIVHGNS